MKIKIKSDGTSGGTIVTTEDGRFIDGIQSIQFDITAGSKGGKVKLNIDSRLVNFDCLGTLSKVSLTNIKGE